MALPKVLRITHSTDNTTIVNNDQIVTVKDIAIDGILADLASARRQPTLLKLSLLRAGETQSGEALRMGNLPYTCGVCRAADLT